MIRRAATPDGVQSKEAADTFCRVYWYPLYGFLRSKGYGGADAQDHVQSFLSQLVERGTIGKADPAKGQLRNYLMTLILRHASSRHRSATTAKRGGGVPHLPMDWGAAEAGFQAECTVESEPEILFRRGLAVRLVEESALILEAEFAKAGRRALFEALLPSLEGAMPDNSFAALGQSLGMSEGAVRVASCRLRERFRKCLRQIASQALGIPTGPGLDEELRQIFGLRAEK